MKTFTVIFITLLLLGMFTASVYAQETGLENDSVAQAVLGNQEKIQNFSESDNKTAYLQQEWGKILEKTAAGRFFLSISNFIKNFNPIFRIVLGYEYSLSWGFFLALLLWLIIFFVLVGPAEAVFENKIFGIIAAFAIATITGLTGFIRSSVGVASMILNSLLFAIIGFVIGIILTIISKRLGKIFKIKIERAKEESKKEQVEKDRTVLKTDAKVAEKDLDSYGTRAP